MTYRFDDLSKDVELGVSRRQILKRMLGSAAGAIAATLLPNWRQTAHATPASQGGASGYVEGEFDGDGTWRPTGAGPNSTLGSPSSQQSGGGAAITGTSAPVFNQAQPGFNQTPRNPNLNQREPRYILCMNYATSLGPGTSLHEANDPRIELCWPFPQ